MNLRIVEAPAGVIPPVELAGRFNLDHGSALLHLAPADDTSGAIAMTLLQTLEKDFRIIGGHTVRGDEHRTYTPMWVQAHDLDCLAVLDAQQMMPSTVQTILGLAPAHQVVLVCEPGGLSPTQLRMRTFDLDPTPIGWGTWLSEYPRRTPKESKTDDGYTLDHLPLVDFLVFRYACLCYNTAERFAAIDADYRRVYHAATTVPPDLDAIIAHLDQTTAKATTTAPMMVSIRATQAALFTRGWLLQAHPDLLLGTLSSIRSPHPTDAHWRALRAYTRPERAATVTLYLLGTPGNRLRTITIAEVKAALDSGAIAARRIPPLARALLTAQILRRTHEQAAPTDSYLSLSGDRRHLEILIDARRDLGLPIDARSLRDDYSSNPTRALYRLGLELRSLT